MTFAGFIIAVAVIGVLFYAWYYFVHRNGTNEVGEMGAQRESLRARNSRPAFGSEVGTIGEREAQDQQPAPIRLRQADGTLNNDNVEIGSIGDFKQDSQSGQQQNFASPQVQQQVRQDAQQAFSSEVGTIGEAGSQKSGAQQQGMQAQAAQGSNFASSQVQQQVRADAQQAFGSEVGSIGEAGQQQQQQLQQQSSSTFANADVQQQMRQDCQQTFSQQSDQSQGQSQGQGQGQGQGQNQTAGAAMQKYTVEAGQIGEELSIIDGQGNTLMPNFIPGTNGMGYYPPQVAQEENKKQQ